MVFITPAERAAILTQIFNNLSRIEDLSVAIQREDFKTAKRLGQEFGDDLRLIEDIGWVEAESTEKRLWLTMPPEPLRRVFTRLRSDVEGLRRTEDQEAARVEAEAREHRDRARQVTNACGRVLDTIEA